MSQKYQRCDLCGLNRATFHFDEVIHSQIQTTSHLCEDCSYRLGVRIPLGNIPNLIEMHKRELNHFLGGSNPVDVDLIVPLPETEHDPELGELLNPSNLAVAEPEPESEKKPILPGNLIEPSKTPLRIDRLSLDPPEIESESVDQIQPLPIFAEPLHISEVHETLVSLFPLDMLLSLRAIPVLLDGVRLRVAMADPFDKLAVANLDAYLEERKYRIELVRGVESDILKELRRHGGPPNRLEFLS
jgi:hypothetical protein